MSRNLKLLGLAALAAFTVSAIGTSTASASGELFHTSGFSSKHTVLTAEGVGNQVLTTTAGTVTCKKVTGTGVSWLQTASSYTIEQIKYSECTTKTIFGELSASVSFFGCDLTLTSDTAQPTHLVCGPLFQVEIAAPGCTIKIGSQTVKGVTYSNIGSHVNINASVTNLHSTATGFACSSTGTSTHGAYQGAITLKGATTEGYSVSVSYG